MRTRGGDAIDGAAIIGTTGHGGAVELPVGADDQGAAFIFREGVASAMERETTARHFSLALAGRAKNVAPVLAEKLPLEGMNCLLDVGGGTGIYSIALLRKHPQLRAIVLDGPEVLKVTQEFAREYDVADRLSCLAGDMFADELPTPPPEPVALAALPTHLLTEQR